MTHDKLLTQLAYNERMQRCMLALLDIANTPSVDENALVTTVVTHVVTLTASDCGYFQLFDPEISTDGGSKCGFCPITKASVIETAKTNKQPLVFNEWLSCSGTCNSSPCGSLPTRHLHVPVLDDGIVVAVLGVGNKPEPYDDFDVQQLQIVVRSLWQTIKNKRHSRNIAQLHEKSRYDHLTGAFTRGEFQRLFNVVVSEKIPAVLAWFDLDNFKNVNDELGHAAGDLVLKRVVNTIFDKVRRSDIVGRIGGDEFVVIFRACDPDYAGLICDSVISQLQNKQFPVGVSVGIAPVTTWDETLSCADTACYAAKRSGKNQVKIHEDSSHAGEKITTQRKRKRFAIG